MKATWSACSGRLADERGFSLAELLVASLLLFVVTFAAINFADIGTSQTKNSMATSEVNQELRETLETMTRQIRVAYYFVPVQCSNTSVGFYSYASGDAAGTKYNIRFQLNPVDATQLMTSQDGGANWTVLATGVENMGITYYNSTGEATSDPTQIAMVNIYLKVTRSLDVVMGTNTEGHVLEHREDYVAAEGEESVAIRNVLTTGP